MRSGRSHRPSRSRVRRREPITSQQHRDGVRSRKGSSEILDDAVWTLFHVKGSNLEKIVMRYEPVAQDPERGMDNFASRMCVRIHSFRSAGTSSLRRQVVWPSSCTHPGFMRFPVYLFIQREVVIDLKVFPMGHCEGASEPKSGAKRRGPKQSDPKGHPEQSGGSQENDAGVGCLTPKHSRSDSEPLYPCKAWIRSPQQDQSQQQAVRGVSRDR